MSKPRYRLRADGTLVGPIRTRPPEACRLVDHYCPAEKWPVRVECLTCGESFRQGAYLPCLVKERAQ